ncbi:FAD-dependent oxidoreductase [Kutzneria sp. CA-103260]|uniref:FAD-dependent oxidoreductase n=1 Tax=Kutzneria sp. CA-103260 TaxID=2802641 RepID=UPI001BA9FDFF|nr:FAD-binding protein [Kutzneria sp. CA-103260]QUQ65167.1 FAD-binding oxidoreductase [Kutzneria sp. CA-103260]
MKSPSEEDWTRLDKAVAGTVVRPGESGFGAVSLPFNRRFAATVPAGVVSVASVVDVQRAIAWARELGVGVAVRGGGHSYAGYSVGPGLVIDLGPLNTVSANASTGLVTAGGGASMSDVYAAIEPCEMAFALGNGATVGIGGLTLGGGVGATSRVHGITADALVATTLVTADGEVLRCSADENPDLFWACRGGGGGNFGVNVSFTFQAQPVTDCATYVLLWHMEDAEKVFSVVQRTMRSAPDAFAARVGVSTTGPDAVVSCIGQHLGSAASLKEVLDPILSVAEPFRTMINDRTYWQAKNDLLHETAAGAFAARTSVLTQPLSEDAIDAMLAMVRRWPGGGNPDGGGAALFSWGGAINRVPAGDTAFPHRDAMFLLSMDTSWAERDSREVVDANLGWLAELADTMAPYGGDRSYLNFTDPDLKSWRTAYYGDNYPRLAEIKRRVDPDGFFTFEQGIGS